MRIRTIEAYEDFAKLKSVWDNLLRSSRTATVFLTFDWIISWWKVFGRDKKLSVLVIEDNDGIRSIAPLMLTNFGYLRRLSLIGGHRSDYNDFIVRESNKEDYFIFFEYLHNNFIKWDELLLENIKQESQLFDIVSKLDASFFVRIKQLDICPYVKFIENSEDIIQQLNKKDSIKRKLKKIKELGDLQFRHIWNKKEILEALPLLVESYLKRYHGSKYKDMFESENLFWRELVNNITDRDILQYSCLELNGEPIAKHFGLKYNNIYYWIKPSFDEKYSKYSPGILLIYFLITYAVSNGLEEFDFLRGAEEFKLRFANGNRKVMQVKIYKNFPQYILWYYGHQLKEKISLRKIISNRHSKSRFRKNF